MSQIIFKCFCQADKGGRCVGLTTLPPSCADCLEINLLEPSRPVQARNGIALPLHIYIYIYIYLCVCVCVCVCVCDCVYFVAQSRQRNKRALAMHCLFICGL